MSDTLDYLCRDIDRWLAEPGVEDICIQEPYKAWVYRHGKATLHDCSLGVAELENLVIVAAAQRFGDISFGERPWPLLMTDIDGRGRLAAVMTPVIQGCPSLTIRRGSDDWPSLRKLTADGLFRNTRRHKPPPQGGDAELMDLYLSDRFDEFLLLAVKRSKSIIMCGANASGKTHIGKAMISEIPEWERLIIMANANELKGIKHPNRVELFVDSNARSGGVSPVDLIDIALRMRIGRLFLNEIRTPAEMLAYLMAGMTGHGGSITSIHAKHCEDAFTRMTYLVMQAEGGGRLEAANVERELRGMVDIIVHNSRDPAGTDFGVDEIYYRPARETA
jgi:type IV secretory pathway ATPase VirB11/archaellum biosynthesis ATPase